MDIQKVIFFLSLFFSVIYARNHCPQPVCANGGFPVRFPFRLEQQPQNCGCPGFDLRCSDQGISTLNLPYSGDFLVRDINYRAQEILLYDPNNCLPSRLLNLNLSSSPFSASYYQNYTFLSCSPELIRSKFTAIDCLSNSTISLLATSSLSHARAMNNCSIVVTLPIPVSSPQQSGDGFSSGLDGDLLLRWNFPSCEDCEAKGGVCGYANSSSQEIFCFDIPGAGNSRGLQILRVIALSVVIPAMICSVAIACMFGILERSRRNRQVDNTAQNSTTATVTPQPSTVPAGLDDSTIESYKVVVFGESQRLPGPNHITCPICLVDYSPKETLRSIPDCQHCFHADCIDEWLRMNGSCPLCRTSPSPARVNS